MITLNSHLLKIEELCKEIFLLMGYYYCGLFDKLIHNGKLLHTYSKTHDLQKYCNDLLNEIYEHLDRNESSLKTVKVLLRIKLRCQNLILAFNEIHTEKTNEDDDYSHKYIEVAKAFFDETNPDIIFQRLYSKKEIINLLVSQLEELIKSESSKENKIPRLKMLDFEESVSYLGISRSSLYKLSSQRKIPHTKPNGKKLYFKVSDLDNWLEKNEVFSTPEISFIAKYQLKK